MLRCPPGAAAIAKLAARCTFKACTRIFNTLRTTSSVLSNSLPGKNDANASAGTSSGRILNASNNGCKALGNTPSSSQLDSSATARLEIRTAPCTEGRAGCEGHQATAEAGIPPLSNTSQKVGTRIEVPRTARI